MSAKKSSTHQSSQRKGLTRGGTRSLGRGASLSSSPSDCTQWSLARARPDGRARPAEAHVDLVERLLGRVSNLGIVVEQGGAERSQGGRAAELAERLGGGHAHHL